MGERAGFEDLRPDDLRHTFATRLIERNVHVISELPGHAQPVSGFGYGLSHHARLCTCYMGRDAKVGCCSARRARRAPIRTEVEQNEAGIKEAKAG